MISLTEASLVSLLTFAAGLWLGHKLTLTRDIRKEFNSAAQPIREWSLRLQNPSHFPPTKPSEIEIDLFRQYLPARKQKSFNSLLAQYDSVASKQARTDSTNSTYYEDLSEMKPIGQELMRLSKRQ